MVLQVFLRKQLRWLWFAIGWHALLDGVAVWSVSSWGVYVTEALVGMMALVSLVIIFKLRRPEPQDEFVNSKDKSLPATAFSLAEMDEDADTLEKTRFQ